MIKGTSTWTIRNQIHGQNTDQPQGVWSNLLIKTEHVLNLLQFVYRAGQGLEDATVTLLNWVFKYLKGNKKHAKLLSSAFNTIQPRILSLLHQKSNIL